MLCEVLCEVLCCVRCCAAACAAQSDSVSEEEEEEVSFIHASSQRKKRPREKETVDVSQPRSSLQSFCNST